MVHQIAGWCRIQSRITQGDPTFKISVAAAMRWHREVWRSSLGDQSALRIHELQRCYQDFLAKAPRHWRSTRGPMGAAWLELQRLGWTWSATMEFTDHRHRPIKLLSVAPARLAQMMEAARQEQLEEKLAETAGITTSDRVDPSPVLSFLRSKHNDARDKAFVASLFCGRGWTLEDLRQAGYPTDGRCELCGAAQDTLEHRVFECKAPKPTSIRDEFKKAFWDDIAAATTNVPREAVIRGWTPAGDASFPDASQEEHYVRQVSVASLWMDVP